MSCNQNDPITYTLAKGGSLSIALRVKSGDPLGTSITAKMKPFPYGETDPPDSSVEPVATFTTALIAATLTEKAYYHLSLSKVVLDPIDAGRYIVDAIPTTNGVAGVPARYIIIELINGVSG